MGGRTGVAKRLIAGPGSENRTSNSGRLIGRVPVNGSTVRLIVSGVLCKSLNGRGVKVLDAFTSSSKAFAHGPHENLGKVLGTGTGDGWYPGVDTSRLDDPGVDLKRCEKSNAFDLLSSSIELFSMIVFTL